MFSRLENLFSDYFTRAKQRTKERERRKEILTTFIFLSYHLLILVSILVRFQTDRFIFQGQTFFFYDNQ